MPHSCDGYSVAALISDIRGHQLAIERSDHLGWAHVAGHRDPHGTLEQAVIAETAEEVGLTATQVRPVHSVRLPNLCSAPDSAGHAWTIYRVRTRDLSVKIQPEEVLDYALLTRDQIQDRVNKTLDYVRTNRPMDRWGPQFWEAAQIPWMAEMDLIDPITPDERRVLLAHLAIPPSKR